MTDLIATNDAGTLKMLDAGEEVVVIAGQGAPNSHALIMSKVDALDFAHDILDALDPEPEYGVTVSDAGETITIHTPGARHEFPADVLARFVDEALNPGLPKEVAVTADSLMDKAPSTWTSSAPCPCGSPEFIDTPWGLYERAA